MTEAFQAAKQALTQAAMLFLPHIEAPTLLAVDASDLAVGGILQQWVNDQWEPRVKHLRSLIGNSWEYI